MEKQLNSSGIFTSLQILQEIQRDLKRKKIEPEEFRGRIIFMSMFNDIDWTKKERFLQGHWTFLGLGSEKKWYGGSSSEREWDTANEMVQRFKETDHLVLRNTSALSRGILKMKKGLETIHFSGDSSNTELLFQTIHSVNQLSIYGAVANLFEQFGLTEEEKGRDNLSVNKSILTSVPSHELQLLVSLPTKASGQQFARTYVELRSIVQQN